MLIAWNAESGEFHIRGERVSYVLRVLENGWLGHVYFGAPLAADRSYGRDLWPEEFRGFGNRVGTPVPLEYPTPGGGDFRAPALVVEQADGSTVLNLAYRSHSITPGKPPIPGLPSTYVEVGGEAETLEVLLGDVASDLQVRLYYTVYRDRPVVVRRTRITNGGSVPVFLRLAMSCALDLPDAEWDLITLDGDWGRERHVNRTPLRPGRQSVSSARGYSSAQHNPFLALTRASTTEDAGEAIGCALAYSGNFIAEVEAEPLGTARARMGINPETFSWQLDPGASFDTPEAILVYSDSGLGDMSAAYHDLLRARMARGAWRDRPRPIVLNSWEATYFDFDEERLVAIAAAGKELGIELFVLDDGWFGQRDDDTTSLGDWQANRAKLPGGIESLARKVEGLGIRFGLWIEPEMISRASALFGAHADWAIGIPSRPRTESRNQFVLDMSRPEVVDHLFDVLSKLLGSAPISYVKWDMNRPITEPFSPTLPPWRQGEFMHRYTLGVYSLYERLTRAFPGVLFESCASGGARFDAGLLAFAPQAWTSDNSDAIDRLAIQWGTSLCYPLSSISAHVSAVPNHQVGRTTPMATRAAVAFFGALGYELDPTKLADEERAEVRAQVEFYKQWRSLFQYGRFVRLRGPDDGDGNTTAWMTISDDRRSAIAGVYETLARTTQGPKRLRLRGLDPGAVYEVTQWPADKAAFWTGRMGGDVLMSGGIPLSPLLSPTAAGDFQARLFVLRADGARTTEKEEGRR